MKYFVSIIIVMVVEVSISNGIYYGALKNIHAQNTSSVTHVHTPICNREIFVCVCNACINPLAQCGVPYL